MSSLSSLGLYGYNSLFMEKTLKEAEKALYLQELPIGALLVNPYENIVLVRHNETKKRNPLCHGEFLVIEEALKEHGPYLSSWVLYVTLQPCFFCQEMIKKVRLPVVYFGAYQYQRNEIFSVAHDSHGFSSSCYVGEKKGTKTLFLGGFYETLCQELLQRFFQDKRHQYKSFNSLVL